MSNSAVTREKVVSARITADIDERAKKNLAKQGLTISEYVRLALIKAANNEVHLLDFLNTPEALAAKKEAETGQIKNIGELKDFAKWIEKINADSKHH